MPRPNRSAFFFFAREYQRQYELHNRGQRINIHQAIAACYDDWKALSEHEKQPYKTQYEEWRMQYRINPQSASVTNQHRNDKQQQILEKRDIPSKSLKLHYDRFSVDRIFLSNEYLPLDKGELLSMPIYIINFQIFCKVDEEDGGQFIPAEICILRYTLMDGVTSYEQKFIEPGEIPTGYTSACLENINETHQIPLRNFCEAERNYKRIYNDLKSFVLQTVNNNSCTYNDDRARRRNLRLTQPCVFFPSLEYQQTSKLLDWLHQKAEGILPTKTTRLFNLASIESLIMVLAELKKQRLSCDDVQRTFAKAAYSYLIEERCSYHNQLGISHCSVALCHAGAKLISTYLNQLYISAERPTSAIGDNHSQNSLMYKQNQSLNDDSMNPTVRSNMPTITIRNNIPNTYYSRNTNDSIASSYHPVDQRKQNDDITKLQQENFHRLISHAESNYTSYSDYQSDNSNTSNKQRADLNQRKRLLLEAIQSIDKQMEELDFNSDT